MSLTAAGAAALALAACGDDASGGGGREQSPRERAQQGALAFARCMRENGVDMPDPQVGENGLVKIGPGPGRDRGPDDPKTRRALDACQEHLEEGGEAPDDAVMAKHRDAFVAYARCMREQGVNVPDPGPEGGVVFKVGDPDAPNPESPAYKRADQVCHEHLAAVDAELREEGVE
ncbi:MAG TPA: hypothetical protein VHF89_13620 [Solirubrobacteraceae bacterium]|nr:hypothetical protein [Solirubrobacteraceae bacterium]